MKSPHTFRALRWLAFVVLTACASNLSAAVIVFTDRSAWETAVGTFDSENFDGLPTQFLATGKTNPLTPIQAGKELGGSSWGATAA